MAAVRQAQILWVLRVVLVVAELGITVQVAQEAAQQIKGMLVAHTGALLFMALAVVAVQVALVATGTTMMGVLGVPVFHPALTGHQLAALAVVAADIRALVGQLHLGAVLEETLRQAAELPTLVAEVGAEAWVETAGLA